MDRGAWAWAWESPFSDPVVRVWLRVVRSWPVADRSTRCASDCALRFCGSGAIAPGGEDSDRIRGLTIAISGAAPKMPKAGPAGPAVAPCTAERGGDSEGDAEVD